MVSPIEVTHIFIAFIEHAKQAMRHILSIYRYGTRACFFIILCPQVRVRRVTPRATQMPSELLWQVSSFEFSGKSIGKTVFEREKNAYFTKWKHGFTALSSRFKDKW